MNIISFLKKLFRIDNKKVHPEVIPVSKSKSQTIIDWTGKPMDKYHWWPMKQSIPLIEDISNNLYAIGGGLSKYDTLFSTKSVEYQKSNYFKSCDSTDSDANWAGFCDAATILACLWKYPKHSVTVTHNNKTQVFDTTDIEALMIIASYGSVCKGESMFLGERYNGYYLEDKSEPYPIELVDMLFKVCKDKYPFAIDIEHKEAVWNYPFNKVIVKRYNKYPHNSSYEFGRIPKTGKTFYYNFIIESDAYKTKNLNLWGWSNNTFNIITQGWFSKKHPDFIWKKYPHHLEWKGPCRINPEINANHIYKIYKLSLNYGGVLNI